jgi:chromosome segregation ATPase
MKSFNNDNVVILQQKLIHLGAEVKRLQADLQKVKDIDLIKKLESENHAWQEERDQWKEKVEKLESANKKLEAKWKEEHKSYEAALEEKKKLKNELTDTRNQLHSMQEELAETRLQLHSVQQELVKSEERLSKLSEENLELIQEARNKNGIIADLESHLIQSNRKVMDSEKENEQLQEGMKTVVSLNESLERENVEFKKKVTQLEEDLKGVHEENSIMHKEMNKLRAFVGNLEKKANIFFPKQTVVAEWKEEKASTADKHSESAEPKIQTWFYNNVKKET